MQLNADYFFKILIETVQQYISYKLEH